MVQPKYNFKLEFCDKDGSGTLSRVVDVFCLNVTDTEDMLRDTEGIYILSVNEKELRIRIDINQLYDMNEVVNEIVQKLVEMYGSEETENEDSIEDHS